MAMLLLEVDEVATLFSEAEDKVEEIVGKNVGMQLISSF